MSEIVIHSTGEVLPALDADQSTGLQIRQWLSSLPGMMEDMTTIDEVEQIAAMLEAVIVRQRQLDEDTADAQRAKVFAFKRIGDLLGPAKQAGNNPYGRAGKPEIESFDKGSINPKPKAARQRDWQARTVAEHWDVVEPIVETMKKPSISAVMKEISRQLKNEEAAAKSNAPMPETGRTYPVIYADPPWRYDFSATDNRKIENQYPTMSIDEIAALEIPAADDAVLLMWATNPKLEEAFKVIKGWGFTYVTNMVWVKDKIGMGYYARSRHELLLIAKRGNLPAPAPADRPNSVIEGERGEHSAKPLSVYETIEKMYPGLPKIELFSRSPQEGWAAWGNQS